MATPRETVLGKRTVRPSEKVRSGDNVGEMALPSHQAAHKQATAAITVETESTSTRTSQPAVSKSTRNSQVVPLTTTSTTTTPVNPHPEGNCLAGQSTAAPPSIEELNESEEEDIPRVKKRKSTVIVVDSEDESTTTNPNPPQSRQNRRAEAESPDSDDLPAAVLKKTRDLDAFFGPPKTVSGHSKMMRACLLCSQDGPKKLTVHDVTTCRRHIESFHEGKYNLWCDKNNFISKLPKAVKARAAKSKEADALKQAQLDPHLKEHVPEERKVPYSDALFRDTAIEWLVATDQPIQAFKHPKFKEMIEVASKATKGVVIPSPKSARKHIIEMFYTNMRNLQTRLASDNVGLISMTCDAWQASNTDAYFAVTGHWNEKMPNGDWKEHSALFGFTQMNSAHDGVSLGSALFKIVKRLGFGHKVGWITCDNAYNNITMLRHFEKLLNASAMRKDCCKDWDWTTSHIRCFAHVINLSTQAVLSTYSSTKHFDVINPDAHEPDFYAEDRDEVGLVRAITVKARSSAKRKGRLAILQERTGIVNTLMLLLDMKVRWSSTHAMLKRAVVLKQFLTDFVYELSREEPDLRKKHKIDLLVLKDEEWERVNMLIKILAVADQAQQAFSYDNTPTLHAALPALEALYKAWSRYSDKPEYARFTDALTAGNAMVNKYYEKTATSHAYTFAMLLNPNMKMEHFEKHWSPELQHEILESAEEIFKERHIELYGNASPPKKVRKGNQKLAKLMSDFSSDEDDSQDMSAPPVAKPWQQEFRLYLNSVDETGDMPLIKWWGINATRFPVWASLAHDYLAIMASSVSSERAFSSAGITITKRRNRLKADIVEALQFLKCQMKKDTLFREPAPSSILEESLEVVEDDLDPDWCDEKEPESWDTLILDVDAPDTDD